MGRCGNGARCICRYGYENGLAGEVQKVETTADLVTGWRVDRRLYRVRLNDPCNMRLDGKAEVDGATYDCALCGAGQPRHPTCGSAHEGPEEFRHADTVPVGSQAAVL